VLAVLPAIVIQAYNELALRRDREAAVQAEALRLAEFAASELNGLVDGAHTLLVTLANAPVVRNRDTAGCDQLMTAVSRDIVKYVGLGALDVSGRWFCAQGGLPAGGFSSAEEPWFKLARTQGGFHIGGYAVSLLLHRGIVPMTLPLTGEDGAITGLVRLSLNLDWLNQRFAARSLPEGASFTVADRDGTVLVRLPQREQVGRPMDAAFQGMLDAERPGTLSGTGPDGSARIVGYVPPAVMADEALLVSVSLSPEEALAGVQAATRRGILLIALGVLLALTAVRVAGRAFVLQPVDALLRAVERWRAGDFSARAGLRRQHSELGRLGAAFDSMAAGLEAHEEEIRRTLAALRESEERFRQFAENSRDVLWMYDSASRRMEYLSPAVGEIWGRDPAAMAEGTTALLATVHPDDRERVAAALREVLLGRPMNLTYRILRPDGEIRWVRDSGFPIRDDAGAVIRVGGISRDITRWQAIEQEREKALRDRELMLREINHRVKNNLQVITSMLRLQAGRSASPEVREAFEDACGRVSTITELHTPLFEGAQISTLDFGSYLQDLCSRLEASVAGSHPADIRIEVETQSAPIDLDRAVPLGLIVNELVTNAIKHGFAGDRGGVVEVRFERLGETYRLSVRDDGPGLVADGQAVLREGLGMQLINGFVRRIRGTLTIYGEQGFEAVVEFPVQAAKVPKAEPVEVRQELALQQQARKS
jgi:PAS domain S-box-containing protein